MTPAVNSVPAGPFSEASTALSSAAQVALQSLSHAMVSAEQQLQVLQEKQQQLLKLQQQVSVSLAHLFIHRRSSHQRFKGAPFSNIHCFGIITLRVPPTAFTAQTFRKKYPSFPGTCKSIRAAFKGSAQDPFERSAQAPQRVSRWNPVAS